MADLSRLVDADDEVIADLLTSTLELVVEAGGYIDPGARLVARDGQLSIESDTVPGSLLLRVPATVMLRVDRVTWANSDGLLEIAGVPDDVGEVELPLLYVQAALHNQCGRGAWLERTHPVLADLPDSVVQAVRELVPSFRSSPMSVPDVLWATRCFRLPVGDGAAPERVLVPLVDLLNHHAAGATGSWDGADFTVDARYPFGTRECALDYGMERDPLELAIVYGFADLSVDIAHTAPAVVHVAGVGDVEVDRLTLDTREPESCVRAVQAASGWPRETAASVVADAAAATIELCRGVREACSADDAGIAEAILRAAADRQAEVLSASVSALSRRG